MRTVKVIYFVLLVPAIIFAAWTAQNSGVTATLYDIYFVDVNNGWAVGYGGTVLHTTNGGLNWVSQNGHTNTSAYHQGISAVSPTTAWFVGNYPNPPDSDIIRKTTDGGNTWFPCTSGVHNPAGVGWSGVHFVDANNGWICSGGPVGGGTDQIILKTANGGNTFTAYPWAGYNGGLVRIFFRDLRHGWAVGGTEDSPTIRGYGIRTSNGGISWAECRRWGATTALTWPLYSGVHFVDTLNGWICGSLFGSPRPGEITRRVDRTTDGGTTWTTQFREVGPLTNVSWDVYFVDNLKGWVVGTDIRRTSDGGATWTVDTSGTLDLQGVHFVDANNGWACGDGGTILKYTGAGSIEFCRGDGIINRVQLNVSNPVNRSLLLSYSLPEGQLVQLNLYDATGQRVKSLFEGFAAKGVHRVQSDLTIPAGVYFVKLSGREESLTRKIVVVH